MSIPHSTSNPLALLAAVSADAAAQYPPTFANSPTPFGSPVSDSPSLPNTECTIVVARTPSPVKTRASHTKKLQHIYGTRLAARRASTSNAPCKPTSHRKRPSQSQMQSKADFRSRRATLAKWAQDMPTVLNSPVNDYQYALLRLIFDEVTPYPHIPYMNIIAVTLGRSFKQVKNWFSNQRQKTPVDNTTLVDMTNQVEKEVIRIRKAAAEVCTIWNDEFFEDLVLIHYVKITRTMRWKERLRKLHLAPSELDS